MSPTDLTPVNIEGSKNFLREVLLSHALDQPDRSSHLEVNYWIIMGKNQNMGRSIYYVRAEGGG